MAESHKRRIVRRTVMALAVMVLMLGWYVGAWLTVSRATHDGIISPATVETVRPAFVPLLNYCESKLPGAGLLRDVWWRINPPVVVYGTPGTSSAGLRWVMTSQLAPMPPE